MNTLTEYSNEYSNEYAYRFFQSDSATPVSPDDSTLKLDVINVLFKNKCLEIVYPNSELDIKMQSFTEEALKGLCADLNAIFNDGHNDMTRLLILGKFLNTDESNWPSLLEVLHVGVVAERVRNKSFGRAKPQCC